MRAAVFTAPYTFEIQERPTPTPRENEVLIAIKSVGICGSDIHPYMGDGIERRQPGIIMGHEASGIVHTVGQGVTAWKAGDRVIINPQIRCGHCEMCRQGHYHLCDHMLLIGSSMRRFLDGAMCEFITMPQDQLLSLPDTVSFDEGTLLDPLGNAIHVVNRGEVKLGDCVVILGAGTIGLLIAQTARLAGAAKVIVIDVVPEKLELAKQVGADAVFDSRDSTVAEQIKAMTGGQGADVVIEAVGIGATYAMSMDLVKKRGTVVALGFAQAEIPFPLKQLVYNEVRILGSTGYVTECAATIELLEKKKLTLAPLITHTFPLEEIGTAFNTLCDRQACAIKVILHP